MIESDFEYQKMFDAESSHWWYRNLHQYTIDLIIRNFGTNKEISILDAGCGTGGLLNYLKEHGYNNIQGFDISNKAISLCKERGLNVKRGDLNKIAQVYSDRAFDVIVSNDNFYYIEDIKRENFIEDVYKILNKPGCLIMNTPALKSFAGIHDICVGVSKRFSQKEVNHIFSFSKFELSTYYWPFLLSPLIFIIRSLQRVKLKYFSPQIIESDINMLNSVINHLLWKIVRFEIIYFEKKPFGSSIMILAKK